MELKFTNLVIIWCLHILLMKLTSYKYYNNCARNYGFLQKEKSLAPHQKTSEKYCCIETNREIFWNRVDLKRVVLYVKTLR